MLTSKTTRVLGALVAAGLGLAGCHEPEQMITAAPPGLDFHSTVQVKEADEPQALGEVAAQSGGAPKSRPLSDVPPALPTAKGEVKTTRSGVKYETLKEGSGAVAKAGQRVTVHYTGTLEDGRKFDSSRDKGQPTTFTVGTGDLITGWDEAIPGMRIGERRKMTVPPNAGYGAQGKGPIPPNATLIFDVELINVE